MEEKKKMTSIELERLVNLVACRFHGIEAHVGVDQRTYHFMDHLSASRFVAGVTKLTSDVNFQRSGRDHSIVHVTYRS